MPVVMTDQHCGRLHRCPLCGKEEWSVWGRARKHWESHKKGNKVWTYATYVKMWLQFTNRRYCACCSRHCRIHQAVSDMQRDRRKRC